MSKFRIVNLIDKLFISVSAFLIIYAWINFYLRDLWATFILSLIFTSAILFVFNYFLNKKKSNVLKQNKLVEEINTHFLIFKLNSTNKKINLLKEILSKEYNPVAKNNTISYIKENKKHLLILSTNLHSVNNNNLIEIIENYLDYNVEIFEIVCNEVSNNINANLFTNKQIKFITKKMLYTDYFLKYNIFPDQANINLKASKFSLSIFLKNLFTPSKARGYFFCGFVLIFSSIILPYHYYYLIIGSILMSFALICKLLQKFKD